MATRKVYLQPSKVEMHDIEFDNLTYEVPFSSGKKAILKSVSGVFKSGELTAIMGPSGAGKSSLLNILSGFQKSGTSGLIRCSGDEAKPNAKPTYKKDSCYILQDDHLCPFFSVWETMMFAAKLKLGESIPEKSRAWLLTNILQTLGLAETIHTRCNRLSGGQRKRLSVALEMIDNPPIMFLDEPTTGLDSLSSYQCVSMLKKLARDGRTIVCTIHQPSASIFEMFDHVYILADGRNLYQGTATNTVPFLRSVGLECPQYHNPADYLLEVANGEYGQFNDCLVKMTRESNWRGSIQTPAKSLAIQEKMTEIERTMVLVRKPSEYYRFRVLLTRNIIQLYRNWTILHLPFIINIAVGTFVGLLFYDFGNDGSKTINNLGYLIISLVYVAYTTMMPAIVHLPNEMPVLQKESFNNWFKLKTFYLSYIVVHVPILILFVANYTLTSYFISGQLVDITRAGMFLLILMLCALVAEGYGVILGTLVNPITSFHLKVVAHCFIAIVLGLLYRNTGNDASKLIYIMGYLAVSSVYMAYTAMLPAVLSLPSEIIQLRKENFNNWYNLKTFYAVHIARTVPQHMIYTALYTSITYTMTGQPLEMFRFGIFFSAAVVLNLISDAYGTIIGTTVKPINGTFIAGVTSAYFILLCGFFALVKQSKLVWLLSFTSYQRFGIHAFSQGILGFNRRPLECSDEYCHYNARSVMDEYAMDDHSILWDMIYLCTTYAVTSIIAYFTLRRQAKKAA